MSKESKVSAAVGALDALRRGVSQPLIVLDTEDGTYSWIPSAHLSDASYTGPRAVVMELSVDGIGGFDPTEADDDEIRSVAEWIAGQDDWWVIEEDEDDFEARYRAEMRAERNVAGGTE